MMFDVIVGQGWRHQLPSIIAAAGARQLSAPEFFDEGSTHVSMRVSWPRTDKSLQAAIWAAGMEGARVTVRKAR